MDIRYQVSSDGKEDRMLAIRLVSWQLAHCPVTLDDLLEDSKQEHQRQSFATVYLLASDKNLLQVVLPPLQAKEYLSTSERTCRIQERKRFALELIKKHAHQKTRRHHNIIENNEELSEHYQLAIDALEEATELVRTLLYDQSKQRRKQPAAAAAALTVDVPRALLILTSIQCHKDASACALQLRDWQLAISHAMTALTSLKSMEPKNKSIDPHRNDAYSKTRHAGDIKLFGLVRVQSLKRVARAMVALHQKATAIELLESGITTCRSYQSKQDRRPGLYAAEDIQKMIRQEQMIERMLDHLLQRKKTKKKRAVNPITNSLDNNTMEGGSLLKGAMVLDDSDVDEDADDSDDDDVSSVDSILSMSSMSASDAVSISSGGEVMQTNSRLIVTVNDGPTTRPALITPDNKSVDDSDKDTAATTKIQAVIRGTQQRKSFNQQQEAAKRLQTSLRCTLALRELTRRKTALVKIQAVTRSKQQRKSFIQQKEAARSLQTSLRCTLALRELTRRKTARVLLVQKEQKERRTTNQSNSAATTIQKSWRGAIVRLPPCEATRPEQPKLRKTSFPSADVSKATSTSVVRQYKDFWKEKEMKAGFKTISVTDWQISPAALVAKEVKFANVSCPTVFTGEMHTSRQETAPLSSPSPNTLKQDWGATIYNSQPGTSFAGLKAIHESWSGSFSGKSNKLIQSRELYDTRILHLEPEDNAEVTMNEHPGLHDHKVETSPAIDKHDDICVSSAMEPQCASQVDEISAMIGSSERTTVFISSDADVPDEQHVMDSIEGEPTQQVTRSNDESTGEVSGLDESSDNVAMTEFSPESSNTMQPTWTSDVKASCSNSTAEKKTRDDSWRDSLQAFVSSSKNNGDNVSGTTGSRVSKYAGDSWRNSLKARVNLDASVASAGGNSRHTQSRDESWRNHCVVKVPHMAQNGGEEDCEMIAPKHGA